MIELMLQWFTWPKNWCNCYHCRPWYRRPKDFAIVMSIEVAAGLLVYLVMLKLKVL